MTDEQIVVLTRWIDSLNQQPLCETEKFYRIRVALKILTEGFLL